MQTFIPHTNFQDIASKLDVKRLGKQRVESWQILNTLTHLKENNLYTTDKLGRRRKRGWLNHPAVLMWQGHEWFLCLYSEAICREWISRGYKDTMLTRFQKWRELHPHTNKTPPSWWGNESIHKSHRSKLLEKNPTHYKTHFPDDEAGLEYVWH